MQSYNFKYVPRRVCLPIGMACNVKCRYCMRKAGKIREPKMTPLIREYLRWLDPKTTEAVVMNGGEPLLYIDRIKEIRSLVHPDIHLTVMTNGTLLTEEFVDWLNANNGELHLSHEGKGAKYLKGVDVLENPRIVKALNKVNRMRIYSLTCSCNVDVMEGYHHIMDKLPNVKNVAYTPFTMFSITDNGDLLDNFDFDLFQQSYMEFRDLSPNSYHINPHLIRNKHRMLGVNVLLDGSIASIATLKKYGTVFNTREEILEAIYKSGDMDFCLNRDCKSRDSCSMAPQCANEISCKCIELVNSIDAAYKRIKQYDY